MKKRYSSKEAADFLGISVITLKRYRKSGKLKPVSTRINGYSEYSYEQLVSFKKVVSTGISEPVSTSITSISQTSITDTTFAKVVSQPVSTRITSFNQTSITDTTDTGFISPDTTSNPYQDEPDTSFNPQNSYQPVSPKPVSSPIDTTSTDTTLDKPVSENEDKKNSVLTGDGDHKFSSNYIENYNTKKHYLTIPEAVVQQINTISPEDLAVHGVIYRAKTIGDQQSYVCPTCNNGTGEDATGIVPNFQGSAWLYHCFKCGDSFNNIKLLDLYYNLDSRTEFKELCRRACFDFGIYLAPPTEPDIAETAEKTQLLDVIRNDISFAQKHLEALPESARRGLSLDILRHFGCGFIKDWTSAQSRINGKFATPTPRLIIPSDDHYLARLIGSLEDFDEKSRKYIKPKQHMGKKFPFAFDSISADVPMNIIVEGEIDAMSIAMVMNCKLPVIATSGATGYKAFIKLLKNKFRNVTDKPKFLILFDPDDTGRDTAPKFVDDLLKAGFPAIFHFLTNEISKLDANDILREQGADMLAADIGDICNEAEQELEAITPEQLKKVNDPVFEPLAVIPPDLLLSEEQKKFLFSGDKSDHDNARRITYLFGDTIRYIADADKWARFKDGFWTVGDNRNSALYPLAAKVVNLMTANAANKSQFATAISMKKQSKMSAAVTMIKGVESIIISKKDLDQHKNLLNCPNGVVDLETGILYPHSPELLLTQQCRAIYRPNFRNETVDKFLRDIQPNEDTLNALLRFTAYGITGEAREEKFLFIDGKGGNGKGTFTGLILYIMNSYGCVFPIEGILLNGRPADPNAPTPAFTILLSKRIVIADEIPPNVKLNVAVIKRLTGRDPIFVRPLHSEAFIIDDPTWTFLFSGNNLPEIVDVHDPGIARRLMNIQFTQDFTGDRADVTLKQRLLEPDALSAMLSILVDHSIAWYKEGLIISQDMKDATRRYLESQDFISEFIAENCIRRHDSFIPRKEFLQRLQNDYATATRGLSERTLTSMVEKIDGISYRTSHGNIKSFYGIGWRDDVIYEQQNFLNDDVAPPF